MSTSTTNTITEITGALKTADSVLPTVIGIVSVFYPQAKLILPFLPLIQEAITAVETVASASGVDLTTALTEVANHLAVGKPNSPILSNENPSDAPINSR